MSRIPICLSILLLPFLLFVGCEITASYNFASEKTSIYCETHSKEGMINIRGKNCLNPKTYNNNALNQPANNYCSTIYKPNNTQFAQQGAVSGSTRLQKLKADTITSNGFSFYSAYGATMANAGNFQGTNPSNNYYVKNRNYPLDGYIHLNKYRENKRLACCDFVF